ncbi:MAG: L,D-transpeptidase, partial [Candidatus Shapirobacteria bacterium]|nr:L,D-transpeptidase [Candidatus Shapirobacteria bacterium]
PIASFKISSGTYNRTPTGIFHIWTKIRSQKMSGGSKELGDYYYLPNVPYIMFFYNDNVEKRLGFSIHGTYWHNNFGVPMSHGCVNMKTSEAQIMFNWANLDTPIVIYGHYQT